MKHKSIKLCADPEVSALNAATFVHSLFSLLRLPLLSFTEAFAMANHILRAHGCADTGGKRNPIHPVLDCSEPPELPGTKPQPIPFVEGVDLSLGFSRSVPGVHAACALLGWICTAAGAIWRQTVVPRRHCCHQCSGSRVRADRVYYVLELSARALLSTGWEDIRLLAPIAEVNLQLVASPGILETDRLAALGLVLRGLLCLEVRKAKLVAMRSLSEMPAHIMPGTSVARIVVETTSGVQFPIVLGAPAQVRSPGQGCCNKW